jgi:hypothetical protein
MPVGIEVTADPGQLRRLERMLAGVKNGVPRALVRGINKVAKSVRAELVRMVARQTGLKQKEVRERNVKARLANFRSMQARLDIFAREVPLSRLDPRQTQAGVSYRAPGGGRKVARGAFILPGTRAVVRRAGRGGADERIASRYPEWEGRRVSRLPVQRVVVRSPMSAIVQRLGAVEIDAAGRLEAEIDKQARLILEKS